MLYLICPNIKKSLIHYSKLRHFLSDAKKSVAALFFLFPFFSFFKVNRYHSANKWTEIPSEQKMTGRMRTRDVRYIDVIRKLCQRMDLSVFFVSTKSFIDGGSIDQENAGRGIFLKKMGGLKDPLYWYFFRVFCQVKLEASRQICKKYRDRIVL